MNDEGFQSDVVIYRITINAYCKAKKYDDAIERFNEMEANNIKRTPHIYSTLISGFGAEKRLIEALKFFELSKLGEWNERKRLFSLINDLPAATSGDEPATGYRVTQRRPGDPNKSSDQQWRSPATCVDGRPRENVS
ncbi:hypothetical protein LguiA_030666 [Lonicera macranthoides]